MMLAVREDFPGYDRLEDVAPRGALAPVGPSPVWRNKFGALPLGMLDKPGFAEFQWLIEDWLSVGDLSLIGGARQSGKTFWILHAGMVIAHARDFFGLRCEAGLAIHQTGEGRSGFLKRLRAWREYHGVQFTDDTPFVPMLNKVDLFNRKEDGGDTDEFIDDVRRIQDRFKVPLRIITIDTVSTATPGADEISGKDMARFLANGYRIKEATGAHVALVGHLNAEGTKFRGHTSLEANADTVVTIVMHKETKVRTVTLEKQKDGEAGLTMKYELMPVPLGEDAYGKAITSCVCLAIGEKAAIRREEERKGFRLSDAEVNFMRCLFDADKQFGGPVPADMSLPDNVRSIVPYDEVKRIFSDSNPSDDAEPDVGEEEIAKAKDARRKLLSRRLKTAREALMKVRVIGVGKHEDKSYIWFTGKPLRAFPHTVPREEAPPPLSADLASAEIPF